MPGMKVALGDNVQINIQCESNDEIERFFAGLSEGGKVKLPLQDMFWGAKFGMLTDKYGIHWMFNYELPKK
jgi:PhnB protein